MIEELAKKYSIEKSEVKTALKRIDDKKSIFYAMSGKMGAGKDTIGDLIQESLIDKGYEVICMSYSTPMRKEISEIVKDFDKLSKEEIFVKYNTSYDNINKLLELLDGENIYKRTSPSRKAIQFWGTDVRRKQDSNYWTNKLVELSIQAINDNKSVYISDVRFPNEVESITDFNGKILRLEVSEEVRCERILKRDNLKPTQEHLNHSSETSLDNYVFHKVFDASLPIDILLKQALSYIE